MPKTRPTGFLDKPLELRQIIYGYILPADRTMTFPASEQRWEEEKTVSSVCATTPHIKEELEELAFKECGAHIMVTPHKEIGLPPAMEWNRFKWISIEIDYIPDHSAKLDWAGMREVICRLRYRRPEILPEITIRLREHASALGDPKWAQDMPARTTYCWRDPWDSDHEDSDCYTRYQKPINEDLADREHDSDDSDNPDDSDDYDDTWLRTDDRYSGNPIAIEILDYFVVLPPCKSAVVRPLRGLDHRRPYLPRHDPERRIFDGSYMEDLCVALGLWLKGDRDGIEFPNGESEFYGEPRLEQIAYQERRGRLYCDGG